MKYICEKNAEKYKYRDKDKISFSKYWSIALVMKYMALFSLYRWKTDNIIGIILTVYYDMSPYREKGFGDLLIENFCKKIVIAMWCSG